ncbi:hypothetical protein SEVIR_8G000900v4 [Setaria viridis]|uniref:Integral membrane bound transporter domain-containing protein n=1 Tax=Setaria viridis TaxID=4556 RepID=A0A4U6TE19_SETVI|nr:uncharacterized protein LOC117833158 [Setaria viridis]TKV98828.1 hypothetical protein SEVIR_8G000900v2 [Setaria viridis]
MAPKARTQQLQLAAASPPMEKKTCPVAVQLPRAPDDSARQLVVGRWRSSLASGLRAALACIIVGLVSLYAPPAVRRHITFPAFSYVVTVIIVTDATLGTALRGAVSALQATLMGAAPSVLALWLAHRTGAAESVLATSAVVALTTFAVALPESVDPVAKRIALGQIIIIYVARFHKGDHPTRAFAVLHPANVVACTALGVAAALLAVLLPWPRLATREATDKARAYRALAAERVRVMVDAAIIFIGGGEAAAACTRQRRWQMAACVSEANRLASASAALLRRMNAIKEDVQWERRAIAVDYDGVETPLTGMQMALSMMVIDGTTEDSKCNNLLQLQEHHADVMAMRDHIRLALLTTPANKQTASFASKPPYLPLQTQQQQQDPCWLFLFSLYQLRGAAGGLLLASDNADANANKKIAPASEQSSLDEQPADHGHQHKSRADEQEKTATKGNKKLVAAAKCGFSLGLAVLLGLLFNNDHGFWSGLIVATTISTSRDSTWAVAAARAHGTALGSVYGAVGCLLISQQQLSGMMDLRLLALVPWMVVATFLKRSRAYGPAGGVSAALSVVIIMGRRYDESPMAFTVARLVETFIGISCAVMADILFQPGARPSVKAREHLTRCIATTLAASSADGPSQSQVISKSLALLRRHAAEAGGEPSYLWLPPFPAACYERIQGNLGRMARLLHLYHQARVAAGVEADEDMKRIHRRFSSIVSTSLRHCLRMLSSSPPPADPPAPHHQEVIIKDDDLEAGNDSSSSSCCNKEEDDQQEAAAPGEVVGAFLAHAAEAAAALLDLDDDDAGEAQAEGDDRGLLVCCLGSMGLCMGEIIREAQLLEAHIIDLNNLQPH